MPSSLRSSFTVVIPMSSYHLRRSIDVIPCSPFNRDYATIASSPHRRYHAFVVISSSTCCLGTAIPASSLSYHTVVVPPSSSHCPHVVKRSIHIIRSSSFHCHCVGIVQSSFCLHACEQPWQANAMAEWDDIRVCCIQLKQQKSQNYYYTC